jgi:hypothetical protein
MGQANVRYPYDQHGGFAEPVWMRKATSYIDTYVAENLLTDPFAEMPRDAESEREIAAGYESNPKIRRAVEDRAMNVVWKHYKKAGYKIENKSRTNCYDLLCAMRDDHRLVEVKGTRTDGSAISLTKNEVELACDPTVTVDLCVVHSIRTTTGAETKAHGGTLVRYPDWNPGDHDLRVVHYECRLTQEPGGSDSSCPIEY